MKADGIAPPLEHGALEIVVKQHPWHAAPGLEGPGVAAQEVLHARIEEEAQEDLPRVAQHHDERHQRPARTADVEVSEMSPVDLGLFARQGTQPQIGFRLGARPVAGDEMAEMIGAAAIAALVHHRVEAAGGKGWKRLQGLADEWQIGIDPRRTRPLSHAGQPGLGQNPGHCAMVHVQLPGDGAGPPLLDVVIAQDLRLKIRGNSHAWLLRGHTGQRFEGPGGGAESLDGRIAGSRSRTSGSVLAAALANRPWMAVCLPPPGPVTANHPAAPEVNPDASRFFAVPGNGGRATHG